MRDPKRIDGVLDALREAWLLDPDLRLGQLVVIATNPQVPSPEVFNIEDELLLAGIAKYIDSKSRGIC